MSASLNVMNRSTLPERHFSFAESTRLGRFASEQ